MKTVVIEAHYLPCIAYFSSVLSYDQVVVEKYEHYEKQSFRNRCYIKGPHRIETLIVPVTGRGGKALTRDVRIDYTQKWLNNHWRTIRTAYGNAAFFEYYAPDLEEVLFKKPLFLFDLDVQLVTLCLKWLKKQVPVTETEVYEKSLPAGVTDLRGVINPKKEDGCNRLYKSIEYQQVFGSKFVPNLSLIDLIFNQGPGAWDIVKASALK